MKLYVEFKASKDKLERFSYCRFNLYYMHIPAADVTHMSRDHAEYQVGQDFRSRDILSLPSGSGGGPKRKTAHLR